MSDDVTRKSADRHTSKKPLEQERWGREPFCFDSWYGGPIPTAATYRQLASMFGGERPDTPAA